VLTALALPTLTAVDAALVSTHTCARLESPRLKHPYAALPSLHAYLRYVALAPGPALALVRQEIHASAVDDGGGRRLERLSVMLWRGYEAKSEVMRMSRLACAQMGVLVEFERDIKDVSGIILGGRNATDMSLAWNLSFYHSPLRLSRGYATPGDS